MWPFFGISKSGDYYLYLRGPWQRSLMIIDTVLPQCWFSFRYLKKTICHFFLEHLSIISTFKTCQMTTRGDSNIFRKIALLLLFFLFLSFPSLLLYFYLRKVFTHVKMTDRLAIDDDGQKLFKKDWILINHFSYFLAPNCCFQSKKKKPTIEQEKRPFSLQIDLYFAKTENPEIPSFQISVSNFTYLFLFETWRK